MTKYALSPKADIDATAAQEMDQISGYRCGEDMPGCCAVTVSSDFRMFKAVAGQKFDGFVSPGPKFAGQPATLFGLGARFRATDTVLDGSKLYGLSNVAAEFDDAATTKIFRAVSRYDLQIIAVGATSV